MSSLVGFSPAGAGLIGGGAMLVVAGGTTVPNVGSWTRPAGVIVPMAGRDGASIKVGGTVPTWADLPADLGLEDRGTLYIVQADGLGYVWGGTAWPADGEGIQIRGPRGEQGRGITTVQTATGGFWMAFSDATSQTVPVPAVAEAQDAAAAAAGSAGDAADSATAAAGAASDAHDDAVATAADRIATGTDASAASASATSAAGDAAQTAADRTATGQDVTTTAASKAAAEAAQAAAETARDDARTARDSASGYATTAGQQASAAAGSASDAHDDAVAAAQSAADASADADRAEQAAANAVQGAPAGGWVLTDLASGVQSSLAKADTASQPGHTHLISDVQGLGTALDGKSNVGHTHTTSDVTGLQAAIDDAVAALVNGAPGALDTLAELAAALGDDPDFAANVTAQIGTKADTTYVDTQLAGKAPTVHTHTASQISDASATGRGVLTGTAAQARQSIGVPSTAEVDAAVGGRVAKGGATVTLWSGTQSEYDALPSATKTAAGFVAVIV